MCEAVRKLLEVRREPQDSNQRKMKSFSEGPRLRREGGVRGGGKRNRLPTIRNIREHVHS